MRYFPKVTADNLVVVPEQYRKKAEDVLTDVANLWSVAEACRENYDAGSRSCVQGLDSSGGRVVASEERNRCAWRGACSPDATLRLRS